MNAIRRIDPRRAISLPASSNNASEPPLPAVPPVVESSALFAGGKEILISHSGAHYRLKITRQGKLILTK